MRNQEEKTTHLSKDDKEQDPANQKKNEEQQKKKADRKGIIFNNVAHQMDKILDSKSSEVIDAKLPQSEQEALRLLSMAKRGVDEFEDEAAGYTCKKYLNLSLAKLQPVLALGASSQNKAERKAYNTLKEKITILRSEIGTRMSIEAHMGRRIKAPRDYRKSDKEDDDEQENKDANTKDNNNLNGTLEAMLDILHQIFQKRKTNDTKTHKSKRQFPLLRAIDTVDKFTHHLEKDIRKLLKYDSTSKKWNKVAIDFINTATEFSQKCIGGDDRAYPFTYPALRQHLHESANNILSDSTIEHIFPSTYEILEAISDAYTNFEGLFED